ncbi:MAG: polysaccharide biosynthesis tyrosine autokinase [Candidatus Aminicenantes bacterium]|nr:polysaccharide biosynthesis tyrosine autokinase [Candidatus Aminicenantes bacterium]
MDYELVEQREREDEVDLLDYWRVIVRHKWIIVACVGLLVLFVGIFTFTATPKYKAKATLLIEEEGSKILSIEDQLGYRAQVTDLRFFNTQIRLLRSKSLAERVVRKMNLVNHPLFAGDKQKSAGLLANLRGLLRRKSSSSVEGALAAASGEGGGGAGTPRNPYSRLADTVLENLEVSPIRDTKLVEVSFTSTDPLLAAQVVNTLADEFIQFSIEKRYEATQQASDFLSEQIAELRDDLAAKERELQRYGEEKQLFFLSDKESTAISKLAEVNAAYTKAQIDRINAEASFRELKNLQIDALPQFISNPVIQNLKTEYVKLKNEYDEKSRVFKPDYPEMVKLRARLESLRQELEAEINKAVQAAETEYRTALNRELSLKRLLDQQKGDVARMNSNAILYNSLKIEVENMRQLLNTLVERQKETLVSARLSGLKTSNISIIDRAEPPRHPVSPKKKLNLMLALLVGLFGGVGLAFVLEYLDNTVKGPEDAERLVGLPSLGVVPYLIETVKKKRYGRYRGYYRYYSAYSYGSYGGEAGEGEGLEGGSESGPGEIGMSGFFEGTRESEKDRWRTAGSGSDSGSEVGAESASKSSEIFSRWTGSDKAGPAKEEGEKTGDKSKKGDTLAEIKEIELVNYYHPNFAISEDFRTIRTSILLSSAGGAPKSIAFTSPLPKEGKSAITANMAVSFAQLGQRVLVIDADLRKPRLHRIFKVNNRVGLSGYLAGKNAFEECVFQTEIPDIWLIPSGPVPPNPAELLNSRRMKVMLEKLRGGFETILVDTPPVLFVIDPVIVSSMVEATVVVVQAGKTTRKALEDGVTSLRNGQGKLIGLVFNAVRLDKGEYYYRKYYKSYYRYYRYGH